MRLLELCSMIVDRNNTFAVDKCTTRHVLVYDSAQHNQASEIARKYIDAAVCILN